MGNDDMKEIQELADQLVQSANGATAVARKLAEHNIGLVRTCREIHGDLRRAVELLGEVMERSEPVFLGTGSGVEPDEYVMPVSTYEDVCAFLADQHARMAAGPGGRRQEAGDR